MRKSVDTVNHSADEVKAEEVFELMHELMHLYRGQRSRGAPATPHGITHMEMKTLGYFKHHPGATASDLAAHTGRDKSQLARLIAGLRERGLLEVQVSETDRRNLHLHCTDTALQALRAMRQQSRKLATAGMQDLSVAEREELQRLLTKLRDRLQGLEA